MPHLKFSTDDLTWNTATFNQHISKKSWTTVNSNFGTTQINSVSYGNGIWVVGGYGGLIRHSTNGNIWTTVTSNFGSTQIINAIEYGNSEFIAVVNTGAIRASTNGISWSTRTGLASNIPKIAYGNGLWVRTETAGGLSTSTDGINWTARTSNFGAATFGNAIAYGNGRWVAGAFNGQIRSSTDAVTWTTVISNFSTNAITSIAYGNNLWTAGGVSATVRLSTDSITWTTTITNFASTNTIESIKYDNGLWIFAASNGWLHSSTDNLVWTTLNSNLGTTIKSINYGNGLWVFGGVNGQVRTSTNPNKVDSVDGRIVSIENTNNIWSALTTTGQVWINQPSDNILSFNISPSYPESITQLSTDNNEFVALFNNEVRRSRDLINWTTSLYLNWTTVRNSPYIIANSGGNFSPTYGGGIWMFPGTSSTDLINWTTVNTGYVSNIRAIEYQNNTWMISSGDAVVISTNGIIWTTASTTMGGNNINGIGYGNGLWVAVGQNGRATRSTDTINWVTTNIMFGNTIAQSVAYGNGIWVVVGDGAVSGLNQGRISNSTDGITWTTNLTSNFFESTINSVAYANGLWVAVGESRSATRIRTSTNGINWNTVTNAPFGSSPNLKSVSYGNGLWAAAGNYGNTFSITIKSTDGTNWTTVNNTFGITNIYKITYGNDQWIVNNVGGTNIYKSLNLENNVNANKIIKTQNNQEMLILANNGEIYKKLKYDTLWTGINTGINDNIINGSVGLDYSSINIDNTGRFWTSVSVPAQISMTANNSRNVSYANGLWVIGASGSGILYSTDFITWVTANSNNYTVNPITYIGNQNNVWFALGGSDKRRSTDAVTWTTIEMVTSGYPMSSIAYGNGAWVAVGGGAAPVSLRSTDSVNWQSINTGFGATINSIAYGNGIFVIAGSRASSQGGQISTSTNGITWITRPQILGNSGGALFNSIEYSNGTFFVKAIGNDTMFRSTDAINWTYVSLNGGTTYSEGFSYYNGMYMLGSNSVYKSTDSTTWTSVIPSALSNAGGSIFGSDIWLYVPNGLSSNAYITPQIYNYKSIVLQGNNASYYSTDMISWTTLQTAPAANTVNAIISKD